MKPGGGVCKINSITMTFSIIASEIFNFGLLSNTTPSEELEKAGWFAELQQACLPLFPQKVNETALFIT
ncbi:MAG: hypothetical protein ACKO0V_17440 [bacterium]